MNLNDLKPRVNKNSDRLGLPVFAKILIVICVGLALDTVIFKPLREQQNHSIARRATIAAPVRTAERSAPSVKLDKPQAFHLRAKSLIQQGLYREAESEAEKALQINPTFYRAQMDLGVIYSSRGDYLKAERAFKAALENIGKDTFDLEIIYGDLGMLCYVEKRFDEAWDYLRRSYERKQYLSDSFWNDKRYVYVKENQKDAFIAHGKNDKALPDEINQRRRRVRAMLGKRNEAVIRNCEQYITDNSGSVYTYVFRSLLASALLRQDRDDLALAQLKIVESENPPGYYIPWIKYMYGYIYKKLGEKQKAIEYLKDVVANYPAYDEIEEVRALLVRLQE